jgi:methionyl-tRNA formyltransferase
MIDSSLRIIFMGTPDFAAQTLQALIDGPDRVVAVVSQPDRPKGRGKKLSPTPVKVLAEKACLPVLQPTKIKTEEFRDELKKYQPDVMVVAAYGRILPQSLLELAPHGCINVHGSLLPAHRGAAPIQWSIINGDDKTGVTIMQMDKGMDTGNILLQTPLTLDADETAGSLFVKLADLGGRTLLEALSLLKQGKLTATPQDDTLATVAPMLKKEHGNIDWRKSAREIHCLIRGLDPWPTAYSFLDGKRLQLFSPEVLSKNCDAKPGTLLQADKRGLLIATGRDCLIIKEVQPEGKKRMPVEAFLCGYSLEPGIHFSS